MQYGYLLESVGVPDQRYVGVTSDLRRRLEEHNSGKSLHPSKFKPWRQASSGAVRLNQERSRHEGEHQAPAVRVG